MITAEKPLPLAYFCWLELNPPDHLHIPQPLPPPTPFPPPHPLPSKAVVTVVLLSKQTNHLFCFSCYRNSTSFFFWTWKQPLPFTQHIVHFTPPAINDHIKGNKLNQSCFKLGCHVVCVHRCKAVQNTQKLNKVITVLETQVGHKSARSRWKFRPNCVFFFILQLPWDSNQILGDIFYGSG